MEAETAQLLVGALGIAGTLAAAVVTQVLAQRGERDRRREDDETRWLRDRLEIATSLLSKAGHVHRELYSAAAFLTSPDGTYEDRATWLAGHNNLIESPEEGLPGIITAEDRELLIEKQFEVTDLLMSMEEDVSRIVLLGAEDEAQAADAMHHALWNAEADLEMFAAPNLVHDSLREGQKAIDAFVAACRPGLRIP